MGNGRRHLRVPHRIAAIALCLACGPSLAPDAAAPLAGCDALGAPGAADVPGLVLVVNDTMRRDRVGAYGGSAATPRLDAFAAEHLLFRGASSSAPWTKPSVASLFTSLHPSQHGVLTHPGSAWSRGASPKTDVLPDAFQTLAEVLRGHGFRTAAFVANPWMGKGFGYEQGFERYDDSFARWDAPGDEVVDAGVAWLQGLADHERFFLYLHTIDSHLPYGRLALSDLERARARPDDRPVPREARRYLKRLRVEDGSTLFHHDVPLSLALIEAAYDRGIEAFDAAFGRLLDAEARVPALGRAALVVTSDHGEAL
ncbi:MAG: sulfatase-like hydrolase/transferase, partial [Myxococcota bacterium]